MNWKKLSGPPLFFFLLFMTPALAAPPHQPTNIQVTHRSGQTFVTWSEVASIKGEHYRIYRHTQPITAATLNKAARLWQVAEGSSRFFADRYNVESSGVWKARYFDRFVIEPLGDPLPNGTGLLVWTLSAASFQGALRGSAYYAVTTVGKDGKENTSSFTRANTTGPIQERVSDPSPVEILRGDGGKGHVYTQYMDLWNWNPTFHAPNESNAYYGLSPDAQGVKDSIQYAYTYTVGEPSSATCSSPMPSRFPVILNLHGWADNSYGPDLGASQYYCAFEVRPIDVSETWWLGFAGKQDYRKGSTVGKNDFIVNYTEARVLRMIYDLLRNPKFKSRIDPDRIYVYGHSMGGSGTLALALRYPKIFSAAYASEPMTNYRASTVWRGNVALKWGSPALNLPLTITGPGHWAAGLKQYNGTGVWDWQNHQVNVKRRVADEFVPFGVAHGRLDRTIDWKTQGKPAYAAFDASLHAWGGSVVNSDHTWLSFQGLPPNYAPDDSLAPFFGLKAVRDETVPGLSDAGGNLELPPPDPPEPVGGYNQTMEWSSSWKSWDGHPIDTRNQWGVSLRTTKGSTQTVDVTPRRVRNFKIVPGRSYKWENRRASDNRLIASGVVKAETGKILTVPRFRVTAQGNRLRLVEHGRTLDAGRPRPWPSTRSGIHVFNDQLSENLSAQQARFAATHYAGTQKLTRRAADRLRAINPNFLVLHYRLGLGLGYREIASPCTPSGPWIKIIQGNDWVREWPASVAEKWFFHWPAGSTERVLNCDWGWYLMELNGAAFRSTWQKEVLRQVRANDSDGVFMDSLSVPNYLGADHYSPALPDLDKSFESAWAARITHWLSWLKAQPLGAYYLVANVGTWITSRERTNYSPADGLMIEGFAVEADQSPYAYEDWQLQMNRMARAVKRNQAILAQSYALGSRERMFTVGCYLLIKGNRTYLNMDLGLEPEWWPEYDIPMGAPVESLVDGIKDLDPNGDSIYRRKFDNGMVLVNPTNPWDGSGVTRTISLGKTYYLAETAGGGEVPSNGIPTGSVSYRPVSSVKLKPYSAAILLNSRP